VQKLNIRLRLQPVCGSIFAFIYINDDLVFEVGVFPDAVNAQLQVRLVVPRRNDDGKVK
jgi:hypothetical protein